MHRQLVLRPLKHVQLASRVRPWHSITSVYVYSVAFHYNADPVKRTSQSENNRMQ